MKLKIFLLTVVILPLFCSIAQAQNITDIRTVDFSNYTHRIGKDTVRLKNGLQITNCSKDAEGIPTGDIWSLDKNSVEYGDLDGDGKDEAFISMIANVCDGNMVTNETVLVYRLEKGKLVKLPEFDYFDEPCPTGEKCDYSRNAGVGVAYDAATKAIVVETFFSTDDDALCCPSMQRRTWFRWNGRQFVETKKSRLEKVANEEN